MGCKNIYACLRAQKLHHAGYFHIMETHIVRAWIKVIRKGNSYVYESDMRPILAFLAGLFVCFLFDLALTYTDMYTVTYAHKEARRVVTIKSALSSHRSFSIA